MRMKIVSIRIKNDDLQQQLQEAQNEIHKLRLQLEKEKNLREMQICKV